MGGSEAIRVLVCDDSPPLRKLVELQLKDDDRFAAAVPGGDQPLLLRTASPRSSVRPPT